MATFSYFDVVPRDVLCQVVSDTMTLDKYLNLRRVSQKTTQQVNQCLRHLDSEGEEGYLFADLVREMQVIETISPNYPVYIQDVADLLYLAQHPTLHEATFDLSDLGDDIETFLTAITEFFGFYSGFGTACQDCQDRYAFTFVRSFEPLSFIQVTEGTLRIQDIPFAEPELHSQANVPYNPETFLARDNPFDAFYQEIGHLVPICELIGTLNENLTGIHHLPCLTKISLMADLSYGLIYNSGPKNGYNYYPFYAWFIDNVMLPNITEYYYSYPKEVINGQHFGSFSNTLLRILNDSPKTYPQVTTFLPIYFDEIPEVQRIFPNLTSIWIALVSLKYARQPQLLDKYQKIVIVIDWNGLLDQQSYIDMFPAHLRDRITFIDSDWLI